jgi:hypothetical protein
MIFLSFICSHLFANVFECSQKLVTGLEEFAFLRARPFEPDEVDKLAYEFALSQVKASDSRSDQFVQSLFDSHAFDCLGQQREADAAHDGRGGFAERLFFRFSTSDTELLKRFRPGDVVMAARVYWQKVVNTRLHEQVALRVLWISPERTKMGLYIVPDSLIGCLWLQLATALAEFNKFQFCEACERPMLVAPEGTGFRSNRKTCSNAG